MNLFRMLICGPCACGKSTLVFNILKEIHRDYDEVYLICPTTHQDLYQKKLKFKKDNIIEEPTNKNFDDLITKVKNNHENKKKSLIVCDDILYTELTKMNSSLCSIFTRIRHWSTSIIVICQHYKQIPPVIRNNVTHSVFFKLANNSAEKVMFEEYSDTFKELYKEYTADKYGFIMCNLNKNELDTDERYSNKINI